MKKSILFFWENLVMVFVTMYKLMTFTIKSEYSRGYEIASGIVVWVNVIVIIYGLLIGLKLM